MRTLTLFEDTPVLTTNGVVLAAHAKANPIIDSFGECAIVQDVVASGEARAVLFQMKDHGDPFVLPETAMIRPRTPEDGTYAPIAASKVDIEDHYFLLPNRKARLMTNDPDTLMPALPAPLQTVANTNSGDHLVWMLQFLEYVEPNDKEHTRRGLVLKFDDIFQARLGGELLGLYGIKVERHRSRPWVYPDQKRPSCFPAKLLAGVLSGEAFADVAYEFYGKGILHPIHRVNQSLIDLCAATGVLIEGQPVENLVKVSHVKVSERKRQTVTLQLSHDALIETVWAQI